VNTHITITRPVVIKVRVTEGYKKTAAAELREAMVRLEGQLKQLEFHCKKIIEMEKNNSPVQSGNLQQIEVERQRVIESRRQLTERLKEIGALVPGQEMVLQGALPVRQQGRVRQLPPHVRGNMTGVSYIFVAMFTIMARRPQNWSGVFRWRGQPAGSLIFRAVGL